MPTVLSERPFFIIGHPRSGTTLLRFMLSSHPRLFIPEETGFMPFLLKKEKIGRLLTLKNVQRIIDRIGRLNYLWQGKVNDINSFYSMLPEARLCFVLDTLFRFYTINKPVIRWGDKTPLYIQYIPILNQIFPTAQFIHIIRDGRDAALSAKQKWPEQSSYMDIHYLLKNWVRNVTTGRQAGLWLGTTRYHEIYYEELVSNTHEILATLCTFLGEEIHPAMFDHTRLAREVGPGPDHHVEVLKPISDTSVARWKYEMTPFEKKLADQIAGKTLAELGYELSDCGPFSKKEYFYYKSISGKYIAIDGLRTFLYKTGFLTLNRTMRKGRV